MPFLAVLGEQSGIIFSDSLLKFHPQSNLAFNLNNSMELCYNSSTDSLELRFFVYPDFFFAPLTSLVLSVVGGNGRGFT